MIQARINDYLKYFIRCKKSKLMIDSCILLLFVVGVFDPDLIPRHKRTKQFTKEQFGHLLDIMNEFDSIMVTPNILTETSNLLSQSSQKEELLNNLGSIVREFLDEEYVQSTTAVKLDRFNRLGLTDAAIISVSRQDVAVLTVDFDLYGVLCDLGVHAFNFNHLL